MTRARGRRWARALGVLALFVLAFWLTGCDPAVFWARRAHLRDIVSQLFPPDWSYLSAIVAPLLATLRMSVTGRGSVTSKGSGDSSSPSTPVVSFCKIGRMLVF